MPRPDRLKRELRRLIADQRERQRAMQPCGTCGRPLFAPDGSLDVRLVGVSEDPCEQCQERAADLFPNRQLYVRIPFARPGLDPDAEQRAGERDFVWSCLDHGMSVEDVRGRYGEHIPDLDGLLAELGSDGPEAA